MIAILSKNIFNIKICCFKLICESTDYFSPIFVGIKYIWCRCLMTGGYGG